MSLDRVPQQQQLLLIGGWDDNKSLGDFWLIEPNAQTSTAQAVPLKPEGTESFGGRYAHATAISHDYGSRTTSIYIAGGRTEEGTSDEFFELHLRLA